MNQFSQPGNVFINSLLGLLIATHIFAIEPFEQTSRFAPLAMPLNSLFSLNSLASGIKEASLFTQRKVV